MPASLYETACGLYQGKQLGWIAPPSEPDTADSPLWGRINIAEYDQYDDAHNADLHAILPGKLIVFSAPQDLGGLFYVDDAASRTHKPTSPRYCGS